MRKIFEATGLYIQKAIDFFYPPFNKLMAPEFFRYGVTGVGNMVFDWLLFYSIYHFVLHQEMLHLGFVTLGSHIAALVFTFPISFLSGFWLQKYVTFTASDLHGKTQLMRYALVVAINLGINYGGLKLFVEVFHFYATPSKMLITIITTIFSYVSQKKFTFR